MAWSLEGSYFESCNCDVLCPCGASFFALPADNERCNVTLVFHVDRGDVDGVDVSGLTWAIVADTPGKMADGNWRVGGVRRRSAGEDGGGERGGRVDHGRRRAAGEGRGAGERPPRLARRPAG